MPNQLLRVHCINRRHQQLKLKHAAPLQRDRERERERESTARQRDRETERETETETETETEREQRDRDRERAERDGERAAETKACRTTKASALKLVSK